MHIFYIRGLACLAVLMALQCWGQTTPGMPRLRKQGTATQLVVEGKPFLALSGELANNAAAVQPEAISQEQVEAAQADGWRRKRAAG